MSGPRYTIFPADALHDVRLRDVHVRVLALIGTHTDNNGWCTVNQRKLGEQCGRTRETVNRAISDLCVWGYLTKQDRITKANGRTISLYQIVMDRPPQSQDAEGVVTLKSQGVVTPEDHSPCDAIASQPNNDPSSNVSPQPPAGGLRFASLWEGYPSEHRGNRDNAEASWNRLSDIDRASALRHLESAVSAFVRRGDRVPALVMYLRNRVFDHFEGAPQIDSDGYFIIKPGMAEWSDWLGWIRRRSGEKRVEQTVMSGVFLTKERWPAKADAA